jgi:hypothetical protein
MPKHFNNAVWSSAAGITGLKFRDRETFNFGYSKPLEEFHKTT